MIRQTRHVALLLAAATLAGCVVIGPTVPVTPGAGRTPAAFSDDRRACLATTDQQVQPVADRRAAAAQAGGQGARAPTITNADLQRMYNETYGQCMTARGNVVGATPGGPQYPSDKLQAATDLTDPDSNGARAAVQDVVAGFQNSCPGERIVVTVTDAPLGASVKARLVALSTPYGGTCFGQPGQNTYVLAKQGTGWTRLLSAEPGSIDVLPGSHRNYRDLRMNSLGMCTYTYAWNGTRYVQTGSDQCATAAPPTVSTLAQATRSPASTATTPVACPAMNQGRPRSRTGFGSVFDGDPASLVELAPGSSVPGPNGTFVNTWSLPAGRAHVLVCRYGRSTRCGPASRTSSPGLPARRHDLRMPLTPRTPSPETPT